MTWKDIRDLLRKAKIHGYTVKIYLRETGGKHPYKLFIEYPELEVETSIPIPYKWVNRDLPDYLITEIAQGILFSLVKRGVISRDKASDEVDKLIKWIKRPYTKRPSWIKF